MKLFFTLILITTHWSSVLTDLQTIEVLEPTLLISTLDGSLSAVHKSTGSIKWSLKEEPVLKVPFDPGRSPTFLPNPKDGSLYTYSSKRSNGEGGSLKKLPFTIPELVVASPCISSDGILYTGSKIDTWFAIDPTTGSKLEKLDWHSPERVCPATNDNTLFLGRTEFHISMFNSKTREKLWNVTFFDYSSHVNQQHDYQLAHFSSSSTGRILTFDRSSGQLLWDKDYGAPIVAVYLLEKEGLRRLPVTSVDPNTLQLLTTQLKSSDWPRRLMDEDTMLFPALYIGENEYGPYALPSLVDENQPILKPWTTLLIEGPTTSSEPNKIKSPVIFANETKTNNKTDENPRNVLILGYYEIPKYSKSTLRIRPQISHDRSVPESVNSSTSMGEGGTEVGGKRNETVNTTTQKRRSKFKDRVPHPFNFKSPVEKPRSVPIPLTLHPGVSPHFVWLLLGLLTMLAILFGMVVYLYPQV